MRRDYVSVAILWFVLTFLGELSLPVFDFFFPMPASEEAVVIDDAFRLLIILGIPVFTFVVAVLVYSIFRFRARSETNKAEGPPIRGSTTVSLTWLLITGWLAIAVLIHPGITGIAELRGNPTADMTVQVTAEKWNWIFTYPAQGITIEKGQALVLPVDTRIKFEVTATDVIHSFWIPAFRMKIDAVPGTTTVMYVTPTMKGTFDDDPTMRVQCAELCGTGHARMRVEVVVVEPDEFQTWLAETAQANAAN
jgi:cytochrome c oxidase subunit 2